MSRFLLSTVTALLLLAAVSGSTRSDEQPVPWAELPKAVVDAVKAKFPAAELKGAAKETEDGATTFEVSLKDKGGDVDVTVNAAGKLVEIERLIDAKDLPKKVREAIEAKHPKATVKSAEERTEFEDGEAETTYEVQVATAEGKTVEVLLDVDGEIEDEEGDVDDFTSDFSADKAELVPTGRNPFCILEPGYQLVLEDGDDRLTITVLDQTKMVDGVETRVVEEREIEDGQLVEVSRNYLAISRRTNNVYYFGEAVDEYRDGKVVSHGGAWLAGVDGAKFGLLMPGLPLLGARYYQEVAPGKALDRAEVIKVGETFACNAGMFAGCLVTEETNPLKPSEVETKVYAPGVGLVREEGLKLVRYGKVEAGAK